MDRNHHDEYVADFPSREFSIIQSGRGAVSGPNSSKSWDNLTNHSGSQDKSQGKSVTSVKSKNSVTGLPKL